MAASVNGSICITSLREYSDNFDEKSFRCRQLRSSESSSHVLNIKNVQAVSMCESTEKIQQLPYDLQEPDEDRAITRGLMKLSERALAPLLDNDPDIYTVEDLKVRFR